MGWQRRCDAPGICGLLLALTLCASTARAQAPEWEVDASEYQYSASLFFAIVENGVLSADGGNLLGFFDADGTCRGSSGLTYIESTDSFVGGMLVHFNQVNPELTALVYVNSMDTIIQDANSRHVNYIKALTHTAQHSNAGQATHIKLSDCIGQST